MIVSNACPIQFWINNVPTFNEKVNPGVQSVPFYQKFSLADEIRIQVLNTEEDLRRLSICVYDCDGERVASQVFTAYDGYYEVVFTFSTLTLTEGVYRLQIETPFSMAAAFGSYNILGQAVILGGQYKIEISHGVFTITGQAVDLVSPCDGCEPAGPVSPPVYGDCLSCEGDPCYEQLYNDGCCGTYYVLIPGACP